MRIYNDSDRARIAVLILPGGRVLTEFCIGPYSVFDPLDPEFVDFDFDLWRDVTLVWKDDSVERMLASMRAICEAHKGEVLRNAQWRRRTQDERPNQSPCG